VHTWSSIAATGTYISLWDDQVSGAIPIGFEFYFYGSFYDQAYISSNGFITFSDGMYNGCCSGLPLPELDGSDNLIALLWDDLYPPNGAIYYQTIGAPGSRVFVVEYDAVPRCCGTSERLTGQIEILEGTGEIYLHYVTDGDSARTSSIGIENQDASLGVQVYIGATNLWPYADVTVVCAPLVDDEDGDGWSMAAGDCNDSNPAINPGAAERCNGVDDDCDSATADGFDETWFERPCDGPDTDLCAEGTDLCSGGVRVCTDATTSTVDLCNGSDDDCDPASVDGSEESWYGNPCDGTDADVCNEGTLVCTAGRQACNDPNDYDPELCNGVDDDCLPGTPDGFGESWYNQPCDGADSDLCTEGLYGCSGGHQTCSDTTSSTLDLCNGVDDDCDPASADGTEESWYNAACDGPDSDLCLEGNSRCTAGARTCTDTSSSTLDLCNGLDDDCDPASADGTEESWYNAACDGPDSDLCLEGNSRCTAGARTCTDTTGSTLDLCNGSDDDCDPASADGSEESWIGAACDGTDADLCNEGTFSCTAGAQRCSDPNDVDLELCNGLDDDCNPATPDGSAEAWLGDTCDGTDTDLCLEGVYSCAAGAQRCSDTTGSTVELCNGLDDDCNPATPDGSAEAWLGAPCDGTDTDLCTEGTFSCSAGRQTCSDATGNIADTCNGLDDDCNPATPDGSGEAWFGAACDGADADLCNEGTLSCSAGAQACSDTSADNPELCNGLDDDCRPSTADGSGEPWYLEPCDGPDSDRCNEGVRGCSAGMSQCTDATGDTTERCNGLDDDCDGSVPSSEDDLDGDGARVCDGDCNDLDPAFHPGAPETDCTDPADYNCDGSVGFADRDADGYAACEDCNDLDPAVHPGAEELCDGVDTNCDAETLPEGELDDDGDGFSGCEGDCDDSEARAFPGAVETCDGVDNDCDPASADGAGEVWFRQPCDGDDTDNCDEGQFECVAGSFHCTDATGSNAELCNGLDDDCDGVVPDDEQDLDDDGFRVCDRDCDDEDAAVNPDAPELCNGLDDDCDDEVDEGDACGGDGDADSDADSDADADADGEPGADTGGDADADSDADGDGDGDADGDGDGDADADADADGGEPPPGEGGCACRSAAASGRGPNAAVIDLLGLVWR
jgi:hypothetical protein